MDVLKLFQSYLIGDFDNSAQIRTQTAEGNVTHPQARHVNRVVDGKIENLPPDLNGFFVLEESYYTQNGRENSMPHLFFFTKTLEETVKLISNEVPADFPRAQFTNTNPDLKMDYLTLKVSDKFTPLVYTLQDDIFYGKCVSQFSADTIFTLEEWIGPEHLLVDERMEKAGRVLIGVPSPVDYRRTK